MGYGKYTVTYEKGGIKYKLCKVWFGVDGSYYLSSPYHRAQKAVLFKIKFNFTRHGMSTPSGVLVDIASVEDDEKRLKLAHHPDGFIQFSGQGILSGKNPNGTIRGMGVMSWPLDAPVRGPAFGVTFRGIEEFARAEAAVDGPIVFRHEELAVVPGVDAYVLEGYYLPEELRRFVRKDKSGKQIILLVHPIGVVIPLKVIFPTEHCHRQGFIGLEMYTLPKDPGVDYASPSFILSSATGNARSNLKGEILAEGLCAMYPRPRSTVQTRRILDYKLSEIPPDGRIDPERR
jgi:hypothetical protein